jgi:hypothetical protein
MSGAGECPAERIDRLAYRCVCNGERGQEVLAEIAATCRAILSIRAVKLLMSSQDEGTRATQEGGMTSAILSAS